MGDIARVLVTITMVGGDVLEQFAVIVPADGKGGSEIVLAAAIRAAVELKFESEENARG